MRISTIIFNHTKNINKTIIMKLHRLFILVLLFNFGLTYGSSALKDDISVINSAKKLAAKRDNKDVVKILAIGNSFSQDALETYLYELAKAENIQVIIGNLYIGGASLELHWNNAKENKPAYQYRKIDIYGNKTNTPETSIADAIADEDWDYISFQQVSSSSGIYESYVEPLPLLFEYVKQKTTNPDVKYVLHQTWAYAQDATHTGFTSYNNEQLTMYNAIVDAAWRAKDLVPIDIVVPAGTAIQNGRTSVIGDNFCSDGYHLDINIGRYTAACTWFETLFNVNVIGNSFKPDALSDFEAEIAQHAAHYAVKKPKEITEMKDFYKEVALVVSQLIVPLQIGENSIKVVSSDYANILDEVILNR